MYGFYRVACGVPSLRLAEPMANAKEIKGLIDKAKDIKVSAILLPEMALTGYSISDIFYNDTLYNEQNRAMESLIEYSSKLDIIIVLGFMLNIDDRLYNCASLIQNGEIKGIIPKQHLPMRREFYEKRHFSDFENIKDLESVKYLGCDIPFGVSMIFSDYEGFVGGIEICEDLWAVNPPSSTLSLSGAKVIFNPSASNELIGKYEYREELVRTQSARCVGAYLYCSSGIGESSTDTVFGGDAMIAEYGSILSRSKRFRFDNQLITADIDLDRIASLRKSEGNFCDGGAVNVRVVEIDRVPQVVDRVKRFIDPSPFVPSDNSQKKIRCQEITSIQAYALLRRLKASHSKKAVIGISGGLDSTLALLSTYKAFKIDNRNPKDIIAITMPGFGTTDRTYSNALRLCSELRVTLREISINKLAITEFEAIGYDMNKKDVTYENVQARARTEILMNIANMEGGIVVGTGDLSEIALGWSTYNGDHMSMYAINSGIPKTLIRYIIEYFISEYNNLEDILSDILNTPVSPELLPHKDGEITQKTEEIVGPYQLHDFFLYHFVKYSFSICKIFFLAQMAFDGKYSSSEIKKWLRVFISRFVTQQFKRSCMPDGPKVGTISLSPRADWRMPSDISAQMWIEELDRCDKINTI